MTAGQRIRAAVHVSDPATLLQVQELRHLAWSSGGETPEFIAKQDILRDEHDVHGVHWIVKDRGSVIAAARLCIHRTLVCSPDPEALVGYEDVLRYPLASLTRLVVHPQFRGQGLASMLDEARIHYALIHHARSIVSIVEIEARMKKLERIGFCRLGTTKHRYLSYAPSYVFLMQVPDRK